MFPVEVELESDVMKHVKEVLNKYVEFPSESIRASMHETLIYCDGWLINDASLRLTMMIFSSDGGRSVVILQLNKGRRIVGEVIFRSDTLPPSVWSYILSDLYKLDEESKINFGYEKIEELPGYYDKYHALDEAHNNKIVLTEYITRYYYFEGGKQYYYNGELFMDEFGVIYPYVPIRTGKKTKSARY